MQALLEERRDKGIYRKLYKKSGIDFASNDYLGFARSDELFEITATEWDKLNLITKVGATGSRLATGNNEYVEWLEKEIAYFHRAEAGLIFNSGYTANLGLLSALVLPQDRVLYDAQIHASMRDGMILSKGASYPFRHNDLEHLEKRLKQQIGKSGKTYVCVDSIYSCDGSKAPLKEICALCEKYHAHLIVDEAHATGIYGPNGKGLISEQSLEQKVFARVHTFSKALGVFGAIVLGSYQLIDFLINFSRPFVYTTALPFPVLVSIANAYTLLKKADLKRLCLFENIRLFREECNKSEVAILQSETPIQPFLIKETKDLMQCAANSREVGLDLLPLRRPTVPKGYECLRICLHTYNTREEIQKCVFFLQNWESL